VTDDADTISSDSTVRVRCYLSMAASRRFSASCDGQAVQAAVLLAISAGAGATLEKSGRGAPGRRRQLRRLKVKRAILYPICGDQDCRQE
jgi:hypothetical protein